MENLPEEIIVHIFQRADFDALKKCHLVCRKWRRIALAFLFRRVFPSSRPSFNAVATSEDLSRFIRIISIDQGHTAMDLLQSIATDPTLRQLVLLPTVGVIRQHNQTKFRATLTGMVSLRTESVLPSLEEIQLTANEEPYYPANLFPGLQRLEIDMATIRLPSFLRYPVLVDLHLRGCFDIDRLEEFLSRHQSIRQVRLSCVSSLRPLQQSPGDFQDLMRKILGLSLDSELVDILIENAEKHAGGQERSFLRQIHARLDEIKNETIAKEIQRTITTTFESMLGLELGSYSNDILGMLLGSGNLQKIYCSIEYLWEDELAIIGTTMGNHSASESGLWVNEEFTRRLGTSLLREWER